MATGHILPGYGNPVTRLRRAQSAYPLDKQKLVELTAKNIPDLDPRTLDHIRNNARNMWLRPSYEPTTYNTFHKGDQLDAPTEAQPTEPLRRHKPHPKPVFLTNRLHYVPGYHNADTTMGKSVYRIDDTFSDEERQLRRHQREKYIARPRTAAVDQYHEPWAQLTDAVGPVEAWGAQAWLKVADDDHQHEVVNAIRDYQDRELFNTSKALPNYAYFQKSQEVPIQDSRYEDQHSEERSKQVAEVHHTQMETTGGIEIGNQKNHHTAVNVNSSTKPGSGKQKMLKEIAKNFALAKGTNTTQTKSEVENCKQKGAVPNKKSNSNEVSQKKTFPLKITMPTEDNVITKAEVENIVSNINNKVYRGENKNNGSLMKQQRVKFRSPVQINKPVHQNINKERTSENETKDKETDASDMKDKNQSDENKVILKYQSPVPPPVADATPRPYTAIPSMHRWMKGAGATESEQVRRIKYGGYPPSTIQPLGSLGHPGTTLQRRQQDADTVRKAKFINKYPRGDFLIHPEYPPSFPHHRID